MARVASKKGKPATGEVALAGQDGAALAKLVRQSKSYGVSIMADVVGQAVRRYKGFGPLLTHHETKRIADAIACVNATADLLGRSRVAEKVERSNVWRGKDAPPDVPFQSFADQPPGVLASPEDAVAFFMSRRPELGIDQKRYGETQRATAFTLARSANAYLTQRVQGIIGDAMRKNLPTADAQRAITEALTSAGVSPKNPQYSEMVFRTNAMDAFQTGMFEQGHAEKDAFPCWCYLIIDDERTGSDHRPKGNKYYPRSAPFAEVRGERPFNCRCSMKWIDRFEWAELEERGFRVESEW